MQTVTYFQNHRSRYPFGSTTTTKRNNISALPHSHSLCFILKIPYTDSRNRWLLLYDEELNHFVLLLFALRVINGLNTRYGHLDNASDKTTCRLLSERNQNHLGKCESDDSFTLKSCLETLCEKKNIVSTQLLFSNPFCIFILK